MKKIFRKFVNFIVIIFLSILITTIYGGIHDQITYTISREYYTKFKFLEFGTNEWGIVNERLQALFIGILATWWIGLFLGIIYAFTSLFLQPEHMLKITFKAILINLITAFLIGLTGLLLGYLYLKMGYPILVSVASDVDNYADFIIVGSMHNFSYAGGVIGFIFGLIYQIKKSKKIVS